MNHERTHVDLFTGLAGFSLAARANGVRTIAMCESDPRCQVFLAKAWPGVPIWPDVRTFSLEQVDTIANRQYIGDMSNQYLPLDSKYEQAPSLYKSGMSIGDCAKYYGITRQAMWKVLSRRGVQFRSNLKSGSENPFHRGGSFASKRASHMVEMAIQKGILIPQPCEVCGLKEAVGHHDDYNKPLEVRWLCRPHHHEWHRSNKAVPLGAPLPVKTHAEIVKLATEARRKRAKHKGHKGTPANGVWLLTAGVP